MANLFTYVFVFGFGMIVVILYLYRKDKVRILPLSEQVYQDGKLSISVLKEKGSVKQIIIQVLFMKKEIGLLNLYLELTSKDKSKKTVDLKPLLHEKEDAENQDKQEEYIADISYLALQELLVSAEFAYESMRFVAESSEGRKYKSHQLAISDRWGLLKMDSGNYN